jgi:hypothetical protein
MMIMRGTREVYAIMPGTHIKKQEGARALAKKRKEEG